MDYKRIRLFLIVLMLFFGQLGVQLQAAANNELKIQLQASKNDQLKIGQSDIAVLDLLSNFYQYNDYQLAWKNQSMIDILLRAIDDSKRLGLSPGDYHRVAIQSRIKEGLNKSDVQHAQLDILLTDAMLRLVYHLVYGKVVPGNLDPDWNFNREFLSTDPVATLHYTLRSASNLKKLLEKRTQLGPVYQNLVQALAQYRQIKQAGGWPVIPAGKVIKPGMSDSRIPLIIQRLLASGDLKSNNIEPSELRYSTAVEDAVKRFQQRHNLETDGVIGKGTLAQMNVPVEHRIEQIRANLERLRWVRYNLGDEFVLVNIAGYKVYYIRDNQFIWQSRVQVGKEYRKTPVFRGDIKYLVLNPTWTVPPTILKKDILPKLKKDPGYLQKKNMNVIDFKGKVIDSSQLNWSTMTPSKFPYMIRQEPGPKNALGQVKIMFPNKHMVYLHDTPSKRNFSRAERAFSSGCIRVENPFELAELLLNDRSKWNQKRFQEILDTGQLMNVSLPQTIPVLLLYFTVQMNDGQVHFFNDIYDRDKKIIQGLNKEFELVIPDKKKM